MKDKVAFVGTFGSGKTHMADFLCNFYGYTKFSFATSLKKLAHEYYNMPLGGPKDRDLLQRLGTAMRSVDPDVFAMKTARSIDIFRGDRRDWELPKPVIVDDLRFKNEADHLRKLGFTIIRILPRSMEDPCNPLRQHVSETEMMEIVSDKEIVSGSYAELLNILGVPKSV